MLKDLYHVYHDHVLQDRCVPFQFHNPSWNDIPLMQKYFFITIFLVICRHSFGLDNKAGSKPGWGVNHLHTFSWFMVCVKLWHTKIFKYFKRMTDSFFIIILFIDLTNIHYWFSVIFIFFSVTHSVYSKKKFFQGLRAWKFPLVSHQMKILFLFVKTLKWI